MFHFKIVFQCEMHSKVFFNTNNYVIIVVLLNYYLFGFILSDFKNNCSLKVKYIHM